MRRISAAAVALLCVFSLCSCRGSHVMDIRGLAHGFTRHSELFLADVSGVYSTEYEYGERYEIILTPLDSEHRGGAVLLSCVCDSGGAVGEVGVAVALGKEKSPDAAAFRDAARAAVTAFTEYSGESAEQALEYLLPEPGEGFGGTERLYFETNLYLYAFCLNGVGARLSVENKRIAPQSETAPTLREDRAAAR